MKFNSTAWHAKLYKYIYSSNLPTNLCPYFWKVVWAMVWCVPYSILGAPALLMPRAFEIDGNKNLNILAGLFSYCAIICVFAFLIIQYNLIKAALGCYSYDYELANITIVMDITIMVIILLAMVIDWYKTRKYYSCPSEPGLVMSFIQAKYKNICPIIEWANPKTKNDGN